MNSRSKLFSVGLACCLTGPVAASVSEYERHDEIVAIKVDGALTSWSVIDNYSSMTSGPLRVYLYSMKPPSNLPSSCLIFAPGQGHST